MEMIDVSGYVAEEKIAIAEVSIYDYSLIVVTRSRKLYQKLVLVS